MLAVQAVVLAAKEAPATQWRQWGHWGAWRGRGRALSGRQTGGWQRHPAGAGDGGESLSR
jgi:hypothetical protein